jgi:hypothetical protein
MCQRAEEAKELETALLSVDAHLCSQGRGKKKIKCPLFDCCGYQRQKRTEANIWFAAHEMMVHEQPKAFGDIGLLMTDENPLDAFMFGVDNNDKCELALDKLLDLPAREDVGLLIYARKDLHILLSKLKPTEHVGAPISLQSLEFEFKDVEIPAPPGGKGTIYIAKHNNPRELASLEWRCKVEPDIRPNMTKAQMRKELLKAAGNAEVKARATLWELIDLAIKDEVELCGRAQVQRGKNGRTINMTGLRRLAKGWRVQTLICDATGDAELLRAIWPQLETEEEPWPQLPRPDGVRIFQIVNRSISKWAVAVEGKHKKEIARKAAAARRMYAAVLLKALEYGGAEVAVIVYKSTEEWIRQNCFVPDWLKLAHHGDLTGTNIFENVRALFEVGRLQPPPEAVVRQTEALFGEFITKRDYVKGKGRIPIVPDQAGHTAVEIELFQHRDPMVRRLLWQAREGAIIQTGGRARAGLRDETTPLDIHRWTDVPVPELGPVEPVLWSEVDAGLDGLMLATGGVWLECMPDAVKAYPDLFSAHGLKFDRKSRGGGSLLIGILIRNLPLPRQIRYQRRGVGTRPVRAITLLDLEATRAWLEDRLGRLASFELAGERQAARRGKG